MKPINQPQAFKLQQSPVARPDNLKSEANRQAKLEQAAEEFEAVLVHQMLQSMQSSLEHGSIFGGSNADRIYGGIGEMELAKTIAKSADFGVKDQLLEYVQKMEKHGYELKSK
jgi:Rod binding domain-containing protein